MPAVLLKAGNSRVVIEWINRDNNHLVHPVLRSDFFVKQKNIRGSMTMAENEGARTNKFIVMGLLPDVCLSPSAPVPYNIIARSEDAIDYSTNVNFGGKEALNMRTRITTVYNNELGMGGGVISGVNKGYCRPVSGFCPTIFINKSNALPHNNTLMWMNCDGPEGPGNTMGVLLYQGNMSSASIGTDGSMPETDPPLMPETPQESGFLKNCFGGGGSLSDMGKAAQEGLGISDLAQKAFELSRVDWSNPMGVLGTIAGSAGMLGLDTLGNLAGYAQKAYGLIKTDWKNPGSVLGAIAGSADMVGLGSLGNLASYAQKAYGLIKTDWKNPASVTGALVDIVKTSGNIGVDWSNPGKILDAAGNLAGLIGEHEVAGGEKQTEEKDLRG